MGLAALPRAALTAAKARGVRLGVNGKALAIQHRAAATEFALTLASPIEEAREAGAATYADIAEQLNRRAIPTREGGNWHPTSVQRVVSRLGQKGFILGGEKMQSIANPIADNHLSGTGLHEVLPNRPNGAVR
jgi:hypothetical protein